MATVDPCSLMSGITNYPDHHIIPLHRECNPSSILQCIDRFGLLVEIYGMRVRTKALFILSFISVTFL